MTKDELSLMVVAALEGILAGIEAGNYSSQELGDLYVNIKYGVDNIESTRFANNLSDLNTRELEST